VAQAPALLGFDDTIDWFCHEERKRFFNNQIYGYDHAGACANSNNNILALWGDRLQYNICRNLEWQVCAAKGMLPGQGGFGMRFSYKPGDLDVYNGGTNRALWQCRGWRAPNAATGCDDGYATEDIYFLEVCLFSQLCENGEDLFTLDTRDFFVCEFSEARFDELARLLMTPPVDVPRNDP